MKMSQKLIALVVVVAMAIGVMGIGVVAFSDVPAGTVTHEAVVTLNALQIMGGYPDGTFQPEGNITRAEFAAVVTRMRAFGTIRPSGTYTGFSDVPASHWASGYIAMAVDMDVVRGMGDGTFAPEAPVTFVQAVAMVMRAIGYQPMANASGGFPTGYMVAAVTAGVTANVGQVVQDQPANRGVVARLAYAALDAPMMQRWVWGTTVEYRIMDGTGLTSRITLLNSVFDVVKLRGRVIANPVTSVSRVTAGGTVVTGDTIMIPDGNSVVAPTVTVQIMEGFDAVSQNVTLAGALVTDVQAGTNARFRIGTSQADLLIGQQVIVYARYMRDGQDRIVLSAAPEAGRNQYVEFAIDLFDEFDTTSDTVIGNADIGAIIRYRATADSRNFSTINVAPLGQLTVIYNGRFLSWNEAFTGANRELIRNQEFANGTIRVLNSDGIGAANVIYINSPRVAVVDEVDVATRIITDRTGNFSTINLHRDNRVAYTITRDGEAITLADLRPMDVLMVEYNPEHSDDGMYTIRVITDVRRNATIRERGRTERSSDGWLYTIGNESFLAAEGAYNLPAGTATTYGGFRLGAYGSFFIDEFGNIAAFVAGTQGPANYGFVFAADQEVGFGSTGERGVLRILHMDGRVSIRRFANVVSIIDQEGTNSTFRGNGSYPDNDWGPFNVGGTPGSELYEFFENGALIRFETNAGGEINAVQVHEYTGDLEVDFVMTGDGAYTFEARNDRLVRESGTVGRNSLNIGANTIVFWVAGERNGMDSTFDVNESDVRNRNALRDGVTYDHVWAFGETAAGDVQILVIRYQDAVVTQGSLAVFASQTEARNAQNEPIVNVTFFQDGRLQTLSTTVLGAESFPRGVYNRGDAFRFSTNSRDEIDGVEWLFTFDEDNLRDFSRENGLGVVPDITPVTVAGAIAGSLTEVTSWDVDLPGSADTAIHFGPVLSRSANRIFVGPETSTDAVIWRESTEAFNIPATANVYVLDMALSGAAQLRVGAVGNIANPSNLWLTHQMIVSRNASPAVGDTFEAPVLEARDWVVIQEHDNRITDVIVIRAANYVLSRND